MIWVGYARAGHEFAVQADIEALGIPAWVPRQINAKRVPTSRVAVAVVAPYLPNYIFVECDDNQWHLLRGIKHLSSTLSPVSTRVHVCGHRCPPDCENVNPRVGYLAFKTKIDADFTARQDAIAAGEKVMEYSDGDVLEIMAGPLMGQLATFRALAETDHDLFPRIRADVELFGRVTSIDLDPINAKLATLT